MKKIRLIILTIFCIYIFTLRLQAQNGLENVIVEKYYISNHDDSVGSIGLLPIGSVTYRVYADMRPGFKFQMAYGSVAHPMMISTSTSFFNNEDRGAIFPTYTKNQAKNNTVMLDSWLSAGAACVGNYGILKSEDDSVSTVVNADGLLQNADTAAGIPLTMQDGFILGSPGVCGIIGLDTAASIFDATSQYGNLFETTNGAWFCLAGAIGPDTNTNKVLIGQFTTDGQFKFNLNIQIGTPTGDIEKYVWSNPVDAEILDTNLVYVADTSSSIGVSNHTAKGESVLIYPNPSNGLCWIEIPSSEININNFYIIYDVLGNSLGTQKMNHYSSKEKLDISQFPNGIYFIELYLNNNKRLTYKLIKK